MFMGVIDTLMVGRVAPEAIGAVGLGSILYFTAAIFGMGMLLGLDTFVSQSYGAGNIRECHRWLRDGVHLAVLATVPLMAITFGLVAAMPLFGLHPNVLALTVPFVTVEAWGSLPLLLYAAFRRYLQALGVVRPVMLTLVAANLVNAAANWVLIYGNLGMPAMGVTGSAWATNLARLFMAVSLLFLILRHEHAHKAGLFDVPFLQRRVGSTGTPVSAGRTGRHAAHRGGRGLRRRRGAGRPNRSDGAGRPSGGAQHGQRHIHGAARSGLGRGGSRRTCNRPSFGRGRGQRRRRGDRAGAGVHVGLGLMFIAGAEPLVRLFTNDPAVVSTGIVLMRVAAAFQLFDGLQVVTTGALRGLGDTRTPMFTNLVGHWLIALPIAAIGGFVLGYGVVGLWVGLCVGLTLVGLFLLERVATPHRRSASEPRADGAAGSREARICDRGSPVHASLLPDVQLHGHRVPVGVPADSGLAVSHPRPRRRAAGLRALSRVPDVCLGVVRARSRARIADRIGRRRTLVIASLGLAGFSASYAFIDNYRLLLALVLVHGIVWSALLSASAAYMTGVLPAGRRAEGIAYWGLASVIAMAIAPSVGFWMYRHSWTWLCVGTTALNLAMAGIAWRLDDDTTRLPTPSTPTPPRLRRRAWMERRVLVLSLPLFLYAYGYGAISSFSAVYADALGIQPKTIYLTTLALVTLVTRPFLGQAGRSARISPAVRSLPGDDDRAGSPCCRWRRQRVHLAISAGALRRSASGRRIRSLPRT